MYEYESPFQNNYINKTRSSRSISIIYIYNGDSKKTKKIYVKYQVLKLLLYIMNFVNQICTRWTYIA